MPLRIRPGISKYLGILLLTVILRPGTAIAEETLEAVLSRMQIQQTLHYRYREVRQMKLLLQPWEAAGELFIAPGQMLIDQTEPRPLLIAITGMQMLYLDRANGIRRVQRLTDRSSLPGITPLLQFFQTGNDLEALEKRFDIRFQAERKRWTIILRPTFRNQTTIAQMELTGKEGEGPDSVGLYFKDGDQTVWFLRLIASGDAAERALKEVTEKSEEEPS